MEDKIEVGEYVKLARNQGINKIIDKKGDMYVLRKNIANKYGYVENFLYEWELKKEIVKHSKQPIDLIEAGDYVNGIRILDITGDYVLTAEYNCCKQRLNNKIKTILTRESYMANCYKVGGENE